jgi:hypothetical protein
MGLGEDIPSSQLHCGLEAEGKPIDQEIGRGGNYRRGIHAVGKANLDVDDPEKDATEKVGK